MSYATQVFYYVNFGVTVTHGVKVQCVHRVWLPYDLWFVSTSYELLKVQRGAFISSYNETLMCAFIALHTEFVFFIQQESVSE